MTNHKASNPRRAGISRLLSACGLFCGLALLAGCASSNPSEESFPAPDYSYLPPLNINVGRIDVSNHVQPGSKDLAARSPTSPTDTLALMAHQRLHATGSSGRAGFTITRADMTRAPHHSLHGSYTVRLAVDDQEHGHHGFIIAHVQRTMDAPGKAGLEHNLHALNTQLMNDMNVELEYQVRSHLASWLTDATGTPLNATIQSQDLNSTPPAGTSLSAAGGGTGQPAGNAPAGKASGDNASTGSNPAGNTSSGGSPAGNASTGTTGAEATGHPHSPPPGVLTLPGH